MGIKKELIYSFLLKCCDLASEQFWKNVFEDLAYGQTPYGTYISRDFLICKYKGKEFSYKLVNKPAEILYEDIYNLLSNRLGILSNNEQNKKKILFEELEQSIRDKREDWNKIRKKNVRDLIIEKYLVDKKLKYNLSFIQIRRLSAVIYLALQMKTLNIKDIVYNDGTIENIQGISFLERKILLNKKITDWGNCS